MKKILYISLSGMTEALGRSQVFEYLIDLSKNNRIYLISFEKEKDSDNLDEIKKLAYEHNIEWKYFNYTNKYGIFSTILQIIIAVIYSLKIVKENRINIIHSRSMIPGIMAFLVKKVYKVKHLFDIRGFVFDEKVDCGRLDKQSFLYEFLKKIEKNLFNDADHVVTLTNKSKKIIENIYNISKEKISVIPTCANEEIFKMLNSFEKIKFKTSLGFKETDIILIHTGAVTNSYDFDLEVKFFYELNSINKQIKFLILNKGQHEFIEKKFKKYNISSEKYLISSSSFHDVHKYLNIATASIFFIPPTFSKQASAPTKFAENLLCNLPSITNSGVGDMDYYIKNNNVGLVLDLYNDSYKINEKIKQINDFLINKKECNCYELYNKYFNKANAVKTYDKIYSKILEV